MRELQTALDNAGVEIDDLRSQLAASQEKVARLVAALRDRNEKATAIVNGLIFGSTFTADQLHEMDASSHNDATAAIALVRGEQITVSIEGTHDAKGE